MPGERNELTPTPLFSVVIPTYDRPRLLTRAVTSVLGQHFGDFEILVIDDASQEDPSAHLASLGDPRIHVVRRRCNGGAAAARNIGIERARGRFVSFLDDDDQLYPTFLGVTHQVFEEAPPEVGFTWTGVRVVEDAPEGERLVEEGAWVPEFRDRAEAYRGFLLERRIGSNCGVTVRADALREIGGFDETMRRAEDTDFFLRLVRHYGFVAIPSTQVQVHHHSGPRLTTYDREFARSYERILETNAEALAEDADTWAALHYKLGWLHHHGGDRKRGRHFLLRVLRRRPWHLKSWAALVLFGLLGARAKALHRRLSSWKKGPA